MSLPRPADVFAAFFAAGHRPEPEPGQVYYGPCGRTADGPQVDPDEPVPYTLTPQAEVALASPEPDRALDVETAYLMADRTYGRPPGTSARLLAGLEEPDPEHAFELAAEVLDEWDSADSQAYQLRVEAGLEPEVEP